MEFSVKAHTPKIFKTQKVFKTQKLPPSELTLGLTPFYFCSYNSQGSSLGKVFAQVLPATSKKGLASNIVFLNFIQEFGLRGSENHMDAFPKFCAKVHLSGEGSIAFTRSCEQLRFSMPYYFNWMAVLQHLPTDPN